MWCLVAGIDYDIEIKQLRATMRTVEQVLDIDAMRREIAELGESYEGAALWVRQKGSFAVSPPLHLISLSTLAERKMP